MKCKICQSTNVVPFGPIVQVLGKYDAQYHQCRVCDLVFVSDPFWLEEAYKDSIANSDLGYCSRNIGLVERAHGIFAGALNLDSAQKQLDYGGGYGMFVRLMRDKGWNMNLYEPYTTNLFAKGFQIPEMPRNSKQFSAVTGFEVLEHLQDPLTLISELLSVSDVLLFSTELRGDEIRSPRDWWYFSLDAGQHITIFSQKTLAWVADHFGISITSVGGLHLFIPKNVDSPALRFKMRFFTSLLGRMIARFLLRRPGLLAADYRNLIGKTVA